MNEFFTSLTTAERIYAACALFGGVLFLIRTVLMFLGHSGADDLGGDVSDIQGGDADTSFKALSLQSLTAFFMMFGLVAVTLSKQTGVGHAWAVLGGTLAGLFTVWVIGRLFVGMKRLQSDGTLHVENAVGQEGEVYLTVKPGKTGQVRVSVQGQLRVFDAATEGAAELKTGDRIRVVRVTGGNVLMVEEVTSSAAV